MKNKLNPLKQLQHDLPASIVVFLVAMPLCLGIAVASGAPPIGGIIAGFVGGIIVGALSGSALGVSGPAAGLATIVAAAIASFDGHYEQFLVAVVLAGIIQFLIGVLRGGFIAQFFPSSVIKGMLSGIGIIILKKQFADGFGIDKTIYKQTSFSEIISNLGSLITPSALIIALVSLSILVLWETNFMKKQKIFTILPGPLIAVMSGIFLGMYFNNIPGWELSPKHMVSIPKSKNVTDLFTFPDFSVLSNISVYLIALQIAVVASLETLLCVEATDKLDPYFKKVTPTNRELRAQGIGNTLSGLIGGLPITQVIVRSSANIQSGGRTKMSAILHGVWIFLSVLFIPDLLSKIPMATLAAILCVVGYKLAKPVVFKVMYKQGWEQFVPFIVTIVVMVVTGDLLLGVGSGFAVAIFIILRNNYKTPFKINKNDSSATSNDITIELAHDLTFLNKASLSSTLEEIPNESSVKIDASKTRFVHPDIIDIIEEFKTKSVSKRIHLTVKGLDGLN